MLGVIKKLPSDLPLDAVTLFTMKLQGSFFLVGVMSKNVDHHGWLTMKNFKNTLAKMP